MSVDPNVIYDILKYTAEAYGATAAVRTAAAIGGRALGVFPPGLYSKFCWLPYRPLLRGYYAFSGWRSECFHGVKAQGGFATYGQRQLMLYKPGMIYLGQNRFWRMPGLMPIGVPGRGAGIIIGKAGSGKSANFIARVALWDGNLLAFDIDGTLTRVQVLRKAQGGGSITGQDGKFCCFDFNGSLKDILDTARWNVYDEMTPETAVRWAAMVSDAMIREDNESQSFFAETSKSFINALILFVYLRRKNKTLVEVRELLTRGLHREARPGEDPHELLFFEMEETPDFGGIVARGGALGRKSQTRDGRNNALSTALTQTAWLDDPSIAHIVSGSDFSVSEFKTRKLSVTMVAPANEMRARLGAFYRIFLGSYLYSAASTPGQGLWPTLCALDEWCAIGKTDGLALDDIPNLYRKYGVVGLFAAQQVSQVESLYGKDYESFFNNVDTTMFLATESPGTIDLIYRKLDVRTQEVKVKQADGSVRTEYRDRPVMTHDDIRRFLNVRSNNAIVFVAGARPMKIKNGRYFKDCSVWQAGADPQYREPMLRALGRRMVEKHLARRRERAAEKKDGAASEASASNQTA